MVSILVINIWYIYFSIVPFTHFCKKKKTDAREVSYSSPTGVRGHPDLREEHIKILKNGMKLVE